MIKVNSISGGKTSSYLAVHYPADYNVFSLVCLDDVRCAPTDKAIIDYVNGKLEKYASTYGEFIATAEDDATIYAMMDLEQILGSEITWVRGKSFDSVINERYARVLLGNRFRLPSWARRYCTTEMKMEPIFMWWFQNIGVKVEMRIGFRFDEFGRMERFFNNSDPTNYKIPVSQSLLGKKLMRHETFNWRYVSMPLIKNGITQDVTTKYWNENGYIGVDNLFTRRRQIKFPTISNCVGCFHKDEETIAAESILNPPKINWFSEQEDKGMGTWFDSRKTYREISADAKDIAKERLYEIKNGLHTCDSGGCTD